MPNDPDTPTSAQAATLDNPPAFPSEGEGHGNPKYHSAGMSLRDYFAGQALAGYFAHSTTPHMNATDAGAYFYAVADAMLAERVK